MADAFYVSEVKKLEGQLCPGQYGAQDFKCNALQECCENACCLRDIGFPLIIMAVMAVFMAIALAYRCCKGDRDRLKDKNAGIILDGVKVKKTGVVKKTKTGDETKVVKTPVIVVL